MSTWLRQSTSTDVKVGPFVDSTDGNTTKTALTITQPDIRLAKNGGAWAQKNAAQTLTHEEAGWYEVTLDATDTNTLGILVVHIHVTGALPVWREFLVVTAQVWDSYLAADMLQVDCTQWLGTAILTPNTAGTPKVDVGAFGGTNGTFTSGKPDVQTVNALAANVITAASINAAAITNTKFATDAIDSTALAASAATKIRALTAAAGTADSGSTTTMVDAALTQADTDYWKGNYILFTSGTIAGQCRLITGFNAATDTVTFAPATTQAVGTNTYEILATANGTTDVRQWIGSTPNALVTGRMDSDVANIQANVITATAINAGAITNAKFAAGAIDAAAIATNAIDADALATDGVNEIRDAVWAQAMTELGAVPGVTGSTLAALEWLFLQSRNKITQTSTTQLVRNDADSATIGTSTVSDDATTFTRGKFV